MTPPPERARPFPPMTNCAFDYYPSAYTTGGPTLMGMNAANEGLLDAFLRHARVDPLYCHVRDDGEFMDFCRRLGRLGLNDRTVGRVDNGNAAALSRVGTLFHPAPGFANLAWVRRFSSSRAYSLLGITHTTATDRVMDTIGQLLIAPIQPWDAVVCTSAVVRRTYARVLADWGDYLESRCGTRPEAMVQLPIIPLGVDTDAFAATDARRAMGAEMRQRHGIGVEDVTVLWVGRLDTLAKAHPIPSYRALERLAQRLAPTGRRVFFVQAGWFPHDGMRDAFFTTAQDCAPTVTHLFMDGRRPEVRKSVWFAADIFLSLSDNVQETFGLTPVEAMAAGLPVVVTDWNGYRDTVRDGIDGFRVPTWMPGEGDGDVIARGFAAGTLPYDVYAGTICQSVAVDIAAGAEALERLATDPGLRARMGAAGRQRAVEIFDWRRIVAAHEDLWADLARLRAEAAETAPRPTRGPAFPLRGDPFAVFGGYSTHTLTDTTLIRLSDVTPAGWLDGFRASPLTVYALNTLVDRDTTQAILARLSAGPAAVGDVVGGLTGVEAAALRRSIVWLAKMGIIALAFAPPVTSERPLPTVNAHRSGPDAPTRWC